MVSNTDNRSEARSNVFLVAALSAGSTPIAARIRNLSAHGVLIEAPSLPPVGSQVELVRGDLHVSGRLAWVAAGQGGINFDGEIDAERWVKRAGHGGQQRVDRVVSALRGSGIVPPEVRDNDSRDSIVTISRALDQVCEDLAATPNMSIELGEKLLKLDTIAQALRRLATGKPF